MRYNFCNCISIFVIILCLYILECDSRANPQLQNLNSGIIQLCGFRDAGSDHTFGFNRIVGGENAEKNEFKWQVSIRLKYSTKLHHICGGTVIGRSWVVTAAHCTKDFKRNEIVVVAGEHFMNTDEGTEQERPSDLSIEHEKYNSITQENDIALIRLTTPFDFSSLTVAPACLPSPLQDFSGDCVASGWGKRREGGKNSNMLQKVWIPLMTDATCKKKMTKIGYDGLVAPSMICAGYEAGGKDACQGDSGGPLICPGKGDLPILVGIVSWGIGCARKDIPGVYTEVSHFVDWINRKVKENSPTSTNRGPFSDRYLGHIIQDQSLANQSSLSSNTSSLASFDWPYHPISPFSPQIGSDESSESSSSEELY